MPDTPEHSRAGRPVVWTGTERDLLRRIPVEVGHCLAVPVQAISHFRATENAAWGPGYHFRFGATGIRGEWTDAAGQHETTISYTRLRRWCEQQPADARAQALTWYRTYPENTRDLPALGRLALAAIDAAAPLAATSPGLSLCGSTVTRNATPEEGKRP